MERDDPTRFYFYNSSIGDLEPIISRYVRSDLVATPGLITNAFGVMLHPRYFPGILDGKEGVEAPPIPSNWHADIAEFAGAFRAVELAKDEFTVVELGCGWGCWMNNTGVIAKRRGMRVHLIGVEGDSGHIDFAAEALSLNGFSEDEYTLIRGVAGNRRGSAFFPKQAEAGSHWGLEPVFTTSSREKRRLAKSNAYEELPMIPLEKLLPKQTKRVDLLHVDIQGGEVPLLADSMKFLNSKVITVLVGTHSREIEGLLFDTFLKAGWILEIERPAIIQVGNPNTTLVDGVQLWRNEKLLPGTEVAKRIAAQNPPS